MTPLETAPTPTRCYATALKADISNDIYSVVSPTIFIYVIEFLLTEQQLQCFDFCFDKGFDINGDETFLTWKS